MSYFEFDTKAKVLSGEDALSHVNFELKIRGKNKPLVITDKGLEKLGVTKKAISKMGLKTYALFTDVPVDSSTETINIIKEFYDKNGCDCIIAVGGGSVIDSAKGAILTIVSGESDISKLEGADVVTRRDGTLFIAVPTTAGTGSEMTSVAVIKDAKRSVKLEYISTFLLPDIAVLDPEMTLTLPARISASTAMDALTHAIEAYTCLMKNPISDAYATAAIKLIFENLVKLLDNLNDKTLRLNLANAALMAGASFSNSMVGAVHSIGHALGGVCSVAHGDAMAILLPHVLEYNYDKCKSLYSELLYFVNPKLIDGKDEDERAELFIREIKNLLLILHERTGLGITLSQTGKVDKNQFSEIAEKAINDGSSIVNPRPITTASVIEILDKAY